MYEDETDDWPYPHSMRYEVVGEIDNITNIGHVDKMVLHYNINYY